MGKLMISAAVLGALCTMAFGQLSGRQIMEQQKALHKSQTEYAEQTLILIDKRGNREQRQLRLYSKEVGKDTYRSLLVFSEPADISGTALLTWQHQEQDDDQWLYLPARGKMQRIAKGSMKNYFMGTDFTFEDLQTEEIENFTYEVLRQEVVDETPTYVVEAVPVDTERAQDSGYNRRVLWIDEMRFTTLKVEFYDRRNKLFKTQTNRDWIQVDSTRWRAEKSLMDNHKTNHKTLIGVTRRTVDKPIADQTFTERFILKGQHIQ